MNGLPEFKSVDDPREPGMCRITIEIDTMKNIIEFTNPRVGQMFNQNELAFLINPLLWSGLRLLIKQKLGEASDIIAPTAKQVSDLKRMQ